MLVSVTAISFVLMMLFIIALHYGSSLSCGSVRLASDCYAGRTADCCAQNRAILPAQVVSHRRTGCATQRSAEQRSTIGCIGVHTGRKEQGDY